jgi:hypothetical protein
MEAAEHGDTPSARCVASHVQRLDGGDLEDALIALGFYGDHHPRELLKMAKSGKLSRRAFKGALSMLGDSYADRFRAQLKRFVKRRELIRSVSDPSLRPQEWTAIRTLNARIREIAELLRALTKGRKSA